MPGRPEEPKLTASPLYALGQLERAIRCVKAPEKAAMWRSVLAGMMDGSLTIGSRTPVAGTPAWVTLEVAHGGFASGRLLAEAPLRDDERALLDHASASRRPASQAPGAAGREQLNLWFLTDAGLDALREALRAGTYQVDLPEDAALPAVAWLLGNGHPEAALDLAAELRPWLGRLRLAPALGRPSRPSDSLVHVATVGQIATELQAMRPPRQLAVMRETLKVWHPLLDRLVALWCDTVEGELPSLDMAGSPAGTVTGGWPCRRWPADWAERRARWLADFYAIRLDPQTIRGSLPAKGTFGRLRAALERCPQDSRDLTGRDVGWIRRTLANTITRNGEPGSHRRASVRDEQARAASLPLTADLAHDLAGLLSGFPADGGIPSLGSVTALAPEGHLFPGTLLRKAERALEAPADELVERGIIGSAEVLAIVLPQITAQVHAAGLEDQEVRRLYAQGYAAFRRRRSLLLLSLERQVRYTDLPWVAALQAAGPGPGDDSEHRRTAARRALEEVTLLALRSFPDTILPNPLVSEMAALARQAGLALPLVEELAADIFMGTFTRKWRDAALMAESALRGTLYARYYGLPRPGQWLADLGDERLARDFAGLCADRSREAAGADSYWRRGSRVAVNGTVIEQSQILTTHNLTALVSGLGLDEQVAAMAPELADRALRRAADAVADAPGLWHHHLRLQAVKNAAYAWRQGIYFLSHCTGQEQQRIVGDIRAAAPDHPAGLLSALDGLGYSIAGGAFGADGSAPGPAGRHRFLGWSAGPHWILAE
jgi:hypothetical protein